MSIYQKLLINLLEWHYGKKIRLLMTMKMEAVTVEQAIATINFERQLELELTNFQTLVSEYKRDLRLTGYIKEREAA